MLKNREKYLPSETKGIQIFLLIFHPEKRKQLNVFQKKGVRSGYMQFVSFFKEDLEIVFIAWGGDIKMFLHSTD